jgi:fructose-1,6-bisphosphatase II
MNMELLMTGEDASYLMNYLWAAEAAAVACVPWIGKNNPYEADKAAVDAMRSALNSAEIRGTIVIGEGEMDEAPMLYIGEQVGAGHPRNHEADIAVDPLECTKLAANNKPNSISVIAVADKGCFLHAPDCYMEKIVVGPNGRGSISLDRSAAENIKSYALYTKRKVEDITIAVLNRPRHQNLIKEIDELGAKIHLFEDGDILEAIATCLKNGKVDMLMGIGGAPEGVIAAAAIKCLNGDMQARLVIDTPELLERTKSMGIEDSNKIYTLNELAKGHVAFIATGVTDSFLLKGVTNNTTHSIVLSNKFARYIETRHGQTT